MRECKKNNSRNKNRKNSFSFFIQPVLYLLICFFLIQIFLNRKQIPAYICIFGSIILILNTIVITYLYHISNLDKLTQLPTHRTFIQKMIIKNIFHNLSNYTIVFFNIKDFTYLNRMYGSQNGDYILYSYGQEIKRFLQLGEIIGRLGGDNFVVLIKTKRLGGFLTFIEKLIIYIKINGKSEPILTSSYCGIYEISEKDSITDAFSKASDSLNYLRAKKTSSYLFYNEEITNIIYREKQIAYQFPSAIENKEFKVYYQPKINIETKKLIGCEALVRWEKDGKIISPIEFIPILEKTSLIKQLDFYVMEQVCKDINTWKAKGLTPVKVSSNFSKLHINDVDFPDKIIRTLNKYNTERNLFELELTETETYNGYSNLIRLLDIMKANKISTSIDDFGIGFSSLSLLKNSNFSVVKIDKSFIDDIEINNGLNKDTLLIQNIINTCHALDKEVICEGVENDNQKNILLKMGCSVIQGYLYDKPLPFEEYEKRLINPDY